MKRSTITATFAAVLSLALVACGGNNAATTTEDAQTEAAAGSVVTAEDLEGTFLVDVKTDGFGVVALAEGDAAPEFDDDAPSTEAIAHVAPGTTVHIEARDYAEYEGWHFVKWTKDGADYSTDNLIEVVVDGDADFVAVFDIAE